VSKKLTPVEISKTIEFCFHAFQPTAREHREAVLRKLETLNLTHADPNNADSKNTKEIQALETALTPDEMRILRTIRARQMMRSEDMMNMDSFTVDVIDGLAPNMKTGELGLVKADKAADLTKLPGAEEEDVLALLMGEEKLEKVPILVQ
jgi:hypothetical protein